MLKVLWLYFIKTCAAANHIRRGEEDIMLVGGTEGTIIPIGFGGFVACWSLSERNDDPQSTSRPQDKDQDGFVMDEGVGVLVSLEWQTFFVSVLHVQCWLSSCPLKISKAYPYCIVDKKTHFCYLFFIWRLKILGKRELSNQTIEYIKWKHVNF
jgi:hypothetical protein